MNVLFCGSFFPENRRDEIWRDSKGPMVISADTFQQALINGWKVSSYNNLSLLTLPCIGSFPKRYKKIYFKKSFFEFNSQRSICGGFLNITGIKKTSIFFSLKKSIKNWARGCNGDKIIIVYGMLPSYLGAAVAIKKQFPEIKICLIALDLPEYFDENKSFLSKIYSNINTRQSYSYCEYVDSYILLTKYMSDRVNVNKKPWMLLEGVYLPDDGNNINIKKEKSHVVFYSGKFDSRFGLINLLEAFISIPHRNYELWLCGEGALRDKIIEYAARDSRIKYWGRLKREEVLTLQKRATVLVNPRQSNAEYTKYSFPSKTMEYMASGTPTIMYKLPGLPDEYLEHLVLVEDDSVVTLKKTILDWCEKDPKELFEFGKKASDFILENKNSKIQAKRIIDFVTSIHSND